MTNWNNLHIDIDKQAKTKFDRYFQDLQKVLEEQNLSERKEEIFHDLENHIIDFMTTNDLKSINLQDALNIITELGLPEDYKDFSTMPGIINEINNKEKGKGNKNSPESKEIKCSNCGFMNAAESLYCLQCGSAIGDKLPNHKLKDVFFSDPNYIIGAIIFLVIILLILIQIIIYYF